MLTYPDIDPVAFSIGPWGVHWYGLTYLIGFILGWWLGRVRAARADSGWTPNEVDELVFYLALAVLLGGRVGYVLFYAFPEFLQNPVILFKVWEGGMSFHGGVLGVMFATWLLGRRFNRGVFECTDFIVPLAPLGLFAGRIGNFINGELWGKPTDVPWGFIVNGQGLHPSQLYEALLEGFILFAILWWYSARPRPYMAVSGLFLLLYGAFRFIVEFYRVPDAHLNYLALGWVTMGQILCVPMIVAGAIMLAMAYRSGEEVKA
jgi:phosphatidylglycerol:prolipoprotein diacylglycerol transferase